MVRKLELNVGFLKNYIDVTAVTTGKLRNQIIENGSKVQPKNGDNVFFVETGDSTDYVELNARQACAIESAAMTNPHLTVFLLYANFGRFHNLKSTPALKAVRSYPNVQINFADIKQLSKGSPMEEFFQSDKLPKSQFKKQHTSDAMRLLLLWKFGGTYLDTDIIVRKRLDSVPSNYACPEAQNQMNGAILNLSTDTGKKFSKKFIDYFLSHFNGKSYAHNGPHALTKVVKEFCKIGGFPNNKTVNCEGFHVMNIESCYPIKWNLWSLLMTENRAVKVMKTVSSSLVVHFWNKFSKAKTINISSKAPYMQLAKSFCPKVIMTCKETF